MFDYFNYFWKWSGESPDKVTPTGTAIYFYILHVANSLNWRDSFSLSSTQIMNGCGIANYKTYKKHFDELVENGFVKIVKQSTNQYSANIIALVKNTEACTTALPKHVPEQDSSTYQSTAHIHKTIKDYKDYKDLQDYKDFIPDSHESNRDQFQTITTLETTPPERKKVAQKKESKNHSFANSKYANNHELFIQDWNNSNGAITFPNADPIRIFETLKNASDANAKYKYSNWLSAAINWVRRNPDEYKRLHITQSGKPLHPVEQRMAETLERLNRNSLNGNADGFGHFTPPSEFGYVP